jgi:hypothetical protein
VNDRTRVPDDPHVAHARAEDASEILRRTALDLCSELRRTVADGAPSAGAPASSGNGGAESGGTGAQSGRGSVQAGEGTGGASQPPVNPTLTAIEPSTLPIGTIEFELVLHGTNYRSDHQVSFDGNLFPTTFVSSEELHAEVPGAALGGRARTVNVLALRLGDPALRSNVLMFEVTEGEP